MDPAGSGECTGQRLVTFRMDFEDGPDVEKEGQKGMRVHFQVWGLSSWKTRTAMDHDGGVFQRFQGEVRSLGGRDFRDGPQGD